MNADMNVQPLSAKLVTAAVSNASLSSHSVAFPLSMSLVPESSVALATPLLVGSHNEFLGCSWKNIKPHEIRGVAVTLMLHAPKWFQRRYTMMIQNVHSNIPNNWVIQVFYTGVGQSQLGVDLNRGLQKFIDSGRLVFTIIPPHVLAVKTKRFEMMTDLWFWQNMLANKVLIFGGNAVICSNSPHSIDQFTRFDYIGSPWSAMKGFGGDGGISIRSRDLMVTVIQYELSKITDEAKKIVAFKSWVQDDIFFLQRIKEMRKRHIDAAVKAVIASRNDTMVFGAMDNTHNLDVFAVSGTLPGLPFKERNVFLAQCPEIKEFYPSLHDPACFGATPDADKCRVSICALKPKGERRGGC